MQNKVKVFPNPEMESQLAVKENQRQKVEFKAYNRDQARRLKEDVINVASQATLQDNAGK
ncbi:Hypothetical predicted protein, partial [Paramuricea clavata]